MALKSPYVYVESAGRREMTIDEFKRWLKKFDADKDGRISNEELADAIRFAGGWFAGWKGKRGVRSTDTNENRYIDESEIKNLAGLCPKARWQSPPRSFVKVNCDAALFENLSKIGIEIVIRDFTGQLLLCKYAFLDGNPDIIQAEATAVLFGVNLAKEEGLKNALVLV
ncbi:hypothetical protein ACFE04_007543 [Oxalis oulophora]